MSIKSHLRDKSALAGTLQQSSRWLAIGLASCIVGSASAARATALPLHLPETVTPVVATSAIAPRALNDPTLFLPTPSEHLTLLVLKLSERRLYGYQGDRQVISYPVAIGRANWETPTGSFTVLQRQQYPTWQHPFTRELVPPGPENPLGARWIGFWTDGNHAIGFHGTPDEHLIGQAVSHGCVRMRNPDIIELYARVRMGTRVIVQP